MTGINPGKSDGQGPWVSHERHRLDDSSSANRRTRSCSILLMREMRLQWMPRLECSRLGLQMILIAFGFALLALIYWARSRGVHLRLQVSFPNPSLLHTTGLRTFLVSRRLLCRGQLAGQCGSSWAFYLQGHRVGLSAGVVGSPPRQFVSPPR